MAQISTKSLQNIDEIKHLLPLSRAEGFRHLDRLVSLWNEGKKFDRPGECLMLVTLDETVIGVGGILRQDEETGRISRVYIHPEFRRMGAGRVLILQLIAFGRGSCRKAVLRTDTAAGAAFYESLGFVPVAGEEKDQATHRLVF